MKYFQLVFLATVISSGLSAQQKTFEETLDYGGRPVELDVKFASDIEVKTWDRQEVYFRADISVEEPGYIDLYTIDIDESGSRIRIASEAEKMFKKFHEDRKAADPDRKNWYGPEYEFNYVLYVPRNARIQVNSINGDLRAETIDGDFKARLINGNIDIASYSGNLELETINGEIDLVMRNASLVAETIHGQIYADEDLVLDFEDRMVGQEVRGNFQNPVNKLRLNTINGNMYLRK